MRKIKLVIYFLIAMFSLLHTQLFAQNDLLSDAKKNINLELINKFKVDGGVLQRIRIIMLIPNDVKDRQTVNSFGFNVNPDSIIYDQGNAYAIFHLFNIDKNFEIRLNADLTIFKHISETNTDTLTNFQPYLQAEKFIEVNSVAIKAIADTLKQKTDIETTIHTYNFVKNYITYKKKATIGAEEVLETAEGKCADFSDLFVALLRVNNIPAKVVRGMTITANNTYHQWAEAYLKKQGWVMFDPTTAHTSIAQQGNVYIISEKNKYVILSQKANDLLLQKNSNGRSYYNWYGTKGMTVKKETKFNITIKD